MRFSFSLLLLGLATAASLHAAPPPRADRLTVPTAGAIPRAVAVSAPSSSGGSVALLRTGDVFEMRLSGMPAEYAADFNLQYSVSQEGTVNVPLIGEMRAAGLTASQLERTVENKLVGDKIFTHPTVLINIAQSTRYVSVSGGVRQPQRLAWSADLTLASAVGNCAGLSDFGSPKGIKLIREGRILGLFNLNELQKDPSRDPKLLPGDQVLVRE